MRLVALLFVVLLLGLLAVLVLDRIGVEEQLPCSQISGLSLPSTVRDALPARCP